MKDWIEGFQASIDYIEQNLSETLDIEDIAAKAALSSASAASVLSYEVYRQNRLPLDKNK